MAASLKTMPSALRSRVNAAKTLNELKTIVQQIEFDLIKQFTLRCLSQFAPQQIVKSFYASPIDQIIPDQEIKKIFAFAPNCGRATNKNMNALGIESELIEMRYKILLAFGLENHLMGMHRVLCLFGIAHLEKEQQSRNDD